MNVWNCVLENRQYMVSLRRCFHEHPEVAGEERETMEVLERELSNLGIQHHRIKGGGMVGVIQGGKPGKSILLRADIDALPMEESPDNLKKRKVICSKNPNAAHTCGHDAHMAILLGAAKILHQHRGELKGRVLLGFEGSEETGAGILPLMEELQKMEPIDGSWGIHVLSEIPVGKISVDPGPRTTTPLHFGIKIIGRGGHGSRPDLCVNPLDVFMDIYAATNHLLAVECSPFYPVKHGIGVVQYGAVTNIIPESLSYWGSFRVLHFDELGLFLHKRYFKLVDDICARHRASYEILKDIPMDMAVVNHPDCSQIAQGSVLKIGGHEALCQHRPWFASESMGIIQKFWPGVFAFVGIANGELGSGAPHHNRHFDLDEEALVYGAAATVQYALDFLAHTRPIKHHPPTKTAAQYFGLK